MIKMLFLASNPKDTATLGLEKEFEEIKKAINKADLGNLFEVVKEEHVHLEDLHQHLFAHQPHIVHFSGHGNSDGEIILQSTDGESVPVPGDALNNLFSTIAKDWRIQCVVLNACFTKKQAEGIAEHVLCVVGMTRNISDDSAIAFATGFYQAIGFSRSVQNAFEYGCNEIYLRGGEQRDQEEDFPRLMAPNIDPRKYVIGSPPVPPSSDTGKLLHGKYLIREMLESGPISKVEAALDQQLERRVAIITLVEHAAKESFAKRVREIARVATHPNIVSVYGAWLDEEHPHYVREYIEGHSLRDELSREGRAALPIDFVYKVLAALGDATNFAQQSGVWDLGIDPEKVLIQKRNVRLNLGLTSNYNIIICPGIEVSEYIRENLPEQLSEERQVYIPPEYFRSDRLEADLDRANQYRLGILGYEMLVGSATFKERSRMRSRSVTNEPSRTCSLWPSINDPEQPRRCPSFLTTAIERMIDPDPSHRFESLGRAIEAMAYRNLHVEVARDSFRRILDKDETEFFRNFYNRFLGKADGIRRIFEERSFPPIGNVPGIREDHATQGKWLAQFHLLKEAIVFLFAYNLLKETQEPTVLTRIATSHGGFTKVEYYDHFHIALLETVVEFDKGNYEDELKDAWQHAVGPGLDYLKARLR